MGKKKLKRLAKLTAKQIMRELEARQSKQPKSPPQPVPSPEAQAPKTVKEQAAEILEAAREAEREHCRISARIAGWDADLGAMYYDTGQTPATVARLFSDALGTLQ